MTLKQLTFFYQIEPETIPEDKPEKSNRVRLGDYRCGHPTCKKGNVYVDDKAVCDDEWDDKDAEVVCKELGFDGGTATTGSTYGYVYLDGKKTVDIFGSFKVNHILAY